MRQGLETLSSARQLLTILSAQSASTYANQVIALVIPWLILTRTGSAASAGTIAFAIGIAAVTGTLVGGLVTDRIGGRRVSILADGLSLITALTLAVALWSPQNLLGRVGSLGAAYGTLIGALAALAFGWLIHTVSAPSALLVCSLVMGAIAASLALAPFMRLLDSPSEPADTTPETTAIPAATQL